MNDENTSFETLLVKEFLLEISEFSDKKSKVVGIDKIGINLFRKNRDKTIDHIISKCLGGTYEFSPYLEILKLKGRDKTPRIISLPTLRDRVTLNILKIYLHSILEEFIPKRNASKEIKKISNYLENVDKDGDLYYLRLDIKDYYNTIDRDKLLVILKEYKLNENAIGLIGKAINNITVPFNYKRAEKKKYLSHQGIPQGISISNILASVYLQGFDEIKDNPNILFSRWVDDILIVSKDYLELQKVHTQLINILINLNLSINEDKSTTSIERLKLTNFLGYTIRPPVMTVDLNNIERFITRISKKVTKLKNQYENRKERPKYLQEDSELVNEFIETLNETITGAITEDRKKRYGWIFFFSEINDVAVLYFIDKKIRIMLSKLKYVDIQRIKKINKAYFEMKYNYKNSKYIMDYSKYVTLESKRKYLILRGAISSRDEYTSSEIEEEFNKTRAFYLSKLENDVSYTYI